jgi:hypothetical protein
LERLREREREKKEKRSRLAAKGTISKKGSWHTNRGNNYNIEGIRTVWILYCTTEERPVCTTEEAHRF